MTKSRLYRNNPKRPRSRATKTTTTINLINPLPVATAGIWYFTARARATPSVWRNRFGRRSTAICWRSNPKRPMTTTTIRCSHALRPNWRLSVRVIIRRLRHRSKISMPTTSYSSVIPFGTAAWQLPCRPSCTTMPRNLPGRIGGYPSG